MHIDLAKQKEDATVIQTRQKAKIKDMVLEKRLAKMNISAKTVRYF